MGKALAGSIHASSEKQDWRTPKALLHSVRQMGDEDEGIALDPCASPDARHHFALCNLTLHEHGDYRDADWLFCSDRALTYVNSEYGRALPGWVEKCIAEARRGCEIIQLTPARTDTRWYRAAKGGASAICELYGRLRFEGAAASAPFPSALFYYGARPYLFCHIFQDDGDVRILGR